MMRVNSVPAADFEAAQKESPAGAAAGLNKDSDQTDTMTGDQFVAAIHVIIQARGVAERIIDLDDSIGAGKLRLSELAPGSIDWIRADLRVARVIYEEMHRSIVRVDFKKIVGCKKFAFENALLSLEQLIGGA